MENRAGTVVGEEHLQLSIQKRAASRLHFDVVNRLNAIIDTRIEVQHRVVHGDNAAGRVRVGRKAWGIDDQIQLGGSLLAAVEVNGVGSDAISERPEDA